MNPSGGMVSRRRRRRCGRFPRGGRSSPRCCSLAAARPERSQRRIPPCRNRTEPSQPRKTGRSPAKGGMTATRSTSATENRARRPARVSQHNQTKPDLVRCRISCGSALEDKGSPLFGPAPVQIDQLARMVSVVAVGLWIGVAAVPKGHPSIGQSKRHAQKDAVVP